MFSDWAGRWEQLILDQKSRMYIVQDDGGLNELAVNSSNLDSKTVALIVDVGTRAIWIWHGKDVGPKDKFVGARAARALKSVVGPKYRTMSPIEEGEESSDFLKAVKSGGVPEKPSVPPVQLEDVPETLPAPPIQLEEMPEAPPAPAVPIEEPTPSIEEIEEEVTIDQIETTIPSQVTVKTTESIIEEPTEVPLPSIDPEKIRDLASLLIVYTLKQIYRDVEPRISRTKTRDLFRVSQEGAEQCKIKIQIVQKTTIKVVEAVFDDEEEESAFYDELTYYLQMLKKINLSR